MSSHLGVDALPGIAQLRTVTSQGVRVIEVVHPGPPGVPGPPGPPVVIKGSLTYAEIIALESPGIGDLYVQSDTTPEGDAGDGWSWTGTEWNNVGSIQGPPGPAGADGATGPPGPAGADGSPGSAGADGSSAYEIAVAAGFTGTEQEWLDSLEGPAGADGVDGATGPAGADGADGADGSSAYELAVAAGFVGTEQEWLDSLVGPSGPAGADGADGADGTSIAIQGTDTYANIIATPSPSLNDLWIQSDDTPEGDPGDGWVWNGAQWENIGPFRGPAGPEGATGPQGPEGPAGPEGPQGPAGADGADGPAGADGSSAYELAVAGGFVGTESEWLASLQGPEGPTGPAGADGADGSDATVTQAAISANGGVISDPTGVTGADAITNMISLTQAEYDAIATPSTTTFYVITG